MRANSSKQGLQYLSREKKKNGRTCQNLWVNNSRSIYVYAILMFTVEPPNLIKQSVAAQFPPSSIYIYIASKDAALAACARHHRGGPN